MADFDPRRILQATVDRFTGAPSLMSVNEALRQLCEMVYTLEGRVGMINFRDGAAYLERGTAPPPTVGKGILYQDSPTGKMWLSEDGHEFVPLDRLTPIGKNGSVLIADSTKLAGVSWSPTISCRVFNSANISVANNTVVALTFDSERWDTATLHDTSTNPSRITITEPGLYIIGAGIAYAANATGRRGLLIRRNGSITSLDETVLAVAGGFETRMSGSTLINLVAGDYVELLAFQTSGSALDVLALTEFSPEFWAIRLSGPP